MNATAEFDYVIVGAGSSGAALANRLSADPSVAVCLVEAGPTDRSPLISMPLGVIWLAKDRRHNWLYTSSPQAGLAGRTVSVPRGRVLGGSSSINGMIYIRGHREDYDRWAREGCAGWDYDSVLPYFKRAEGNANPRLDDAWHGREGPLAVCDQRDPNPADLAFVEAAGRMQIRACADFNAPSPEGVGIYQVTQLGGRRHSSAAAYLAPVRSRSNLTVLTGLVADRVEITGRRATGVALRDANGGTRAIGARREVILSAGTIGSPDILLRSGVGPAGQIKAIGGSVTVDLPGVGRNLQDHVDVMVISASRSRTPYGLSVGAVPRLAGEALKWLFARRGMLASNMVEAGGFVRSSPAEQRPDLQLHLIPGKKSHRGRMFEYGHGVSLHTCVLRPKSRGSVTRSSAEGPPVIDLGLLTHQDDVVRLARGVRIARDILRQAPFGAYGLSEILPGENVQSEEELHAFVRANARTVYHPVGTCAMGAGQESVVDPRLRVRHVDGLRVVDCSVMPTIVSGNTNAPAIMIAEKAADMIVEDWRRGALAA